ncbi:MAG TPA: fasciclin domain-containing protein, partial [Sunxiuqinia sp.]|nr:fasciclin domain-containing protein [Sunxiuqinia sp.]
MDRNKMNRSNKFSITVGRTYRLLGLGFAVIMGLVFMLSSCNSDVVGDTYYTFKGETIGQYLINHPESFSEFTDLLERTEVIGLLKAYGKYTLFVPNNDAMFQFYKSKGKSSLDDFPADTLKKIAYDHIIKDFIVTSDDFVDGFLPNLTMSGRNLKISFEGGANGLIYKVNTSSTITTKDIEVHNGVIHALDEVLAPTENTLEEAIAGDSKFSLFYKALMATGLNQKIAPIKDDSYIPPATLDGIEDGSLNGIGGLNRIPKERKYGFTALMESDDTYAGYGINNLDDLKAYAKQVYDQMYPDDAGVTDVTDPRNSLNRFIAYHLINKKIPSQYFIYKFDNTGSNYDTQGETHSVKTVDMFEYIEPMCANTLIEVRTLRQTNEYNVFNMIPETGDAVRLTDDFDNDAVNGVYHEIDHILAYTPAVDRMLSSKRLRMDAASFFPEMTNNGARVGHATKDYPDVQYYFPRGYIDRVKTSETTTFGYINADDRFCDYQGDEVFLSGLYDFEITTPPVPAGTYEVRFGYQPTPFRGAAQLYWDGIPTGIPLDLRFNALNPKIGFERPGLDPTDPKGYENDKMMRNRGYMKGPACYKVINPVWYGDATVSARNSQSVLRRILGIYTFDKATTHKFSVKAVRSGQFMF